MTDQTRKADIVAEIQERNESFRAEVPPYAWSRIESRLENDHSRREISFYKWWYYAAMFVLLGGMVTLISLLVEQSGSGGPQTVQYSESIRELHVSDNSYPVYNIHQLQKAYLRLQESTKGIPPLSKETEGRIREL
jgi:hypothetical protein